MTNEFDIALHPSVFKWLKEFAKNEPLGFCFLTGGNITLFQRLWGEPNGQNQKFGYWKKEHMGVVVYVYSDDKSTFYKVQYLGTEEDFVGNKKMGNYLIGFLNKLIVDVLNN